MNEGATPLNAYSASELERLRSRLRTPLLSDVLDAQGLRNQALSSGLRLLTGGAPILGYAFTARLEATDEVPDVPYVGLLASLDAIQADEVYVVSGPSNGAAIWGELVSTAIAAKGARGAICDGVVRDLAQTRAISFPVVARGTSPKDCLGRADVAEHGVPIEVGGVTVRPGDLMLADEDGVVCVPRDVIVQTVELALAKSQDESLFRDAVSDGVAPSAAFAKFGVL